MFKRSAPRRIQGKRRSAAVWGCVALTAMLLAVSALLGQRVGAQEGRAALGNASDTFLPLIMKDGSPLPTATAIPPTATPIAPTATSVPTTFPGSFAWSKVASQPFRNSEGQSAVVGGKLYSFGGFDSTKACCTPTDRAYVYTPGTNQWTVIAPLPFIAGNGQTGGGVTHAGIATDGTNIFLAGGYIAQSPGSGQVFGTKQVWRYNVAANSYTRLPDFPIERSAGQLAYLNGNLHYISGTNLARTQDVPEHYVLSLSNLAAGWQPRAALPNPRHHAATAVINGRIYYIGGQKGHDGALVAQSDVHVYDPGSNSWTPAASLPQPRNHAMSSTVVFRGRIVVMGGQSAHGTSHSSVYAYNPATNSWATLNSLPVSRHSAIGGVINDTLYFSTGGSVETYKGVPNN
jgi:N-acetylneuraminic acid mutarotase